MLKDLVLIIIVCLQYLILRINLNNGLKIDELKKELEKEPCECETFEPYNDHINWL